MNFKTETPGPEPEIPSNVPEIEFTTEK